MTRDVLLLSLYLTRMWLQGQCCLILAAGRRLEIECKCNLYPKVLVTRANSLTLFLKEKKIFLIYVTKFAQEFTYSDIHVVPWETKEHIKNKNISKILKKDPHRYVYLVAVCMPTHRQHRSFIFVTFSQ